MTRHHSGRYRFSWTSHSGYRAPPAPAVDPGVPSVVKRSAVGRGRAFGPTRSTRRIARTDVSAPAAPSVGARELPNSLLKKSERDFEASGFVNSLRIMLASACSASASSCDSGMSVVANSSRRSRLVGFAPGPPAAAASSRDGRMTPNHSGGGATFFEPRATRSDSSAVPVIGVPAGQSVFASGIRGESPASTRWPSSARYRRAAFGRPRSALTSRGSRLPAPTRALWTSTSLRCSETGRPAETNTHRPSV